MGGGEGPHLPGVEQRHLPFRARMRVADRGQKIATASADVKVVELSSGRMLYSTVKQASAVASSEAEAVESARRTLAQKTVGEDLAASLP